jgi:hypothetical protein
VDEFRFTSSGTHYGKGTANRADTAADRSRRVVESVDDLRDQLDRLQLICEAMWTVVKRRTGADERELTRLIEEIDLRDGKLDGRAAPAAQACARCKRVVSVRTGVCLYCGAQNFKQTAF